MPQELVKLNGNNIVQINCSVSFDNVLQVYEEGTAILKDCNGDMVTIDLTKVEDADSSCLALLVEWMRLIKLAEKTAVLNNPSRELLDLGRVCGLDEVLPFG